MRRPQAILATVTLASALVLGGCADESPDAVDASPTPSASPSVTASVTPSMTPSETASETPPAGPTETSLVIAVVIKDGIVTPNGERIEVPAGEAFWVTIDSDVADSLHFHSTPEQEIEFSAGSSQHEVTFDQPGVVDVELHGLHVTVAQLEVR